MVSKKKKAYKKLNNPLDLFHITLFDTWVENDDRKPTNYNLILAPKHNKFSIIPIDNAFIFSTMSYANLNPKFGIAVSSNEHLLVSDLGYLIKKNTIIDDKFVKNEREYFYLCLEKCKEGFDDFMNQIADIYIINSADVQNLSAFLFNKERNNKVFNEYLYRLKQ